MGAAKSMNVCRRRHPREDVTLAGSAMSVTRSRSVMITDVSALGARIGGRDLPAPGDDVLVVIGSQERMGTVKWRDLEKCGICLDQPFGHSNIAQMKREAHWASVTGWGH
jgi:hypothetical protein